MSFPYRQYIINNSTVKVYYGDILNTTADVIVNSVSTRANMRSNLSAAILPLAGEQVKRDVHKMLPAKIGDVVVSTAGKLPQKYLFHTVWGSNQKGSEPAETDNIADVHEYILQHSIRRCFALLKSLNLDSIAFPCLGAGRLRIPYEKIAKCMAKNIAGTLKSTSKELTVEIYLYDVYEEKEKIDFLPFFEWLAAYSHISRKEIETENNDEIELTDIKLNDIAGENDTKADVFVSYSRKDSNAMKMICSVLNDLGKSYWVDVSGIYSGDNYKEIIVKAITQASIVLFLSSENSNNSPNVAKEIGIADKYGKVIIPVKLDNSPFNPKMDYDLSGIDAIDFCRADEKSVSKLRNAILGQMEMNKR